MNLTKSKNTRLYLFFSPVFILFFFAYSCDEANLVTDDKPVFDRTQSSTFQMTSQDLYGATSQGFEKTNFAISPLSIQLALYMIYNGAEGNTKKEIGDLLHVMDADLEQLDHRLEWLMDYFRGMVQDGQLDIHNGLFYDAQRVKVGNGFVDRLSKYFDVHRDNLDFASPSAVESINNWVQEKTYDKIKEVIQNIAEQEVLFLLNAIYLKADWVTGFQPEATADRAFVTSAGNEIMIPTMHRTGGVDHLAKDGSQIVRLPLADSTLYMYLIMPDQSDQLSSVVDSKIVSGIWNNTLEFQSSRVMLEVPVVESKTHVSLNGALQSLGMVSAFDPQKADLQMMGEATNGLPLTISRTLHDVYLKMDEKGVEGAAVTTIGVGTTSVPPSLQFNKPFMYLVVDRALGLPLFIGQFTGIDPQK